jgi:hypothetical protein
MKLSTACASVVVLAVWCCVGVAPCAATALNTNTSMMMSNAPTPTPGTFEETYATAMDALRAFADAMATSTGRESSTVGDEERRTRVDAAARAVDALDAELGETFRDALARGEMETVMRMVRELVDGAKDVEDGVEGEVGEEDEAKANTRNGTATTTATKTKTDDDTVDTAAETRRLPPRVRVTTRNHY